MFKSAAPHDLPPELRWRYEQLDLGESVNCWLVGPPIGVNVHWNVYSKPCRRSVSDGKLKCVYGARCTPRFVSYLPLIHADKGHKFVLIASKSLWGSVSAFANGVALTITRPKALNNPPLRLKVAADAWATGKTAACYARRKPEDIRPYLLHLWQDRLLCETCGQEFFPSAKTASAEDVPTKMEGVQI